MFKSLPMWGLLWLLFAPAIIGAQEPKATGARLGGKQQKIDDLTLRALNVPTKEVVPAMCWGDAKGSVVFVLDKGGLVRRITVSDFTETHQLDVGLRCDWLSLSGQGLLVTVSGAQQVWLLDPQTLEVKKKVNAPTATQAVSAPKLKVAYVTNGKQLAILDLVKGKLGAGVTGEFESLAVTPDGAYLLTASDKIIRSKIGKTGALKVEEVGPVIASGRRGSGLMLSGDGKWVALPTGGGNVTGLANHPAAKNYPTFIYPVKNLKKPDITLELGAYPEVVGYDPAAKLIYAQNADSPLIVCKTSGLVQKQYRLKNAGDPRQYLVHPDGRKMLLLSERQLAWVEWR